MEGYLSEIRYWAPTWVPKGWSSCSGQLLSIANFSAVYSLLGTMYGGDGRTTFALPDLRGRVAVGAGSGPGLTPKSIGQRSGSESVTLSILDLPSHNHAAQTTLGSAQLEIAASGAGSSGTPVQGSYAGVATDVNGDAINLYSNSGNPINGNITGSATTTVLNQGGNLPHENEQPYLVLTPIICLYGIYPSRN